MHLIVFWQVVPEISCNAKNGMIYKNSIMIMYTNSNGVVLFCVCIDQNITEY